MNYFLYHGDKDVVTYDDVTNGISYFYGKEKKNEALVSRSKG
jgi:hypothetical protein